MTNTNDIPKWAAQMACDEANALFGNDWSIADIRYAGPRMAGHNALAALARRIARTEKEPVDPLLVEAREICDKAAHTWGTDREYKFFASLVLEGIERGIEIGEGK